MALSSRAGWGRAWRTARRRARASASERADGRLGEAEALGQLRVRGDPAEDRAALPVAARPHVVRGAEEGRRRPQVARHLLERPGVGGPFDALRVGVLAGRERTVRQGQLARHVVQRVLHDRPVARLAGELPRVEVGAGELGVVVEHLLEVGHQPLPVGRVAREAAAQLVVDAAVGHGVQGAAHHRQRRLVGRLGHGADEERLDEHGRRGTWGRRPSRRGLGSKLASRAATAVGQPARVQVPAALAGIARVRADRRARRDLLVGRHRLRHAGGRPPHAVGVVVPGAADGREHLAGRRAGRGGAPWGK